MMSVLYYIGLNGIWGIIEFLNLYVVANNFLLIEKRKTSNMIKMCVFSAYMLVLVGFSVMKDQGGLGSCLWMLLFSIKSFFLLSLYFQVRLKHVFMNIFFVGLNSSIAGNLYLVLLNSRARNEEFLNLVAELITSILLLLFLCMLNRMKKSGQIEVVFSNVNGRDYILFIVIIYAVSILEYGILNNNQYAFSMKMLAIMVYFSVALLICRTLIIVKQKNDLVSTNYLLERQMKQTIEYYNEWKKKNDQIKKFRHDVKNLLHVLYKLISKKNHEKALEYIEDLQEICKQCSEMYDTGNFVANAILSTKYNTAEQFGIRITFDGRIPTNYVKDIDMAVILSNLLDNSIEACQDLCGEKEIYIKSILKPNIWVLTMDNPSKEVLIDGKNRIKTSKKCPGMHGFGMRNVRDSVKKYNGKFTCSYEKEIFRAMVSIVLNVL